MPLLATTNQMNCSKYVHGYNSDVYFLFTQITQAFLSKEMMYSCALWSEAEGGVRGDLEQGPTPGDLEAAQLRKIRHVLKKARVQPGHRILEFGSGWGGLAIEVSPDPMPHLHANLTYLSLRQAVKTYGCEVDTLTLSIEQKKLAEERVQAAGLEGRIRVHLLDYREIPAEFEKAFDAFVSIEMLEVSLTVITLPRAICL